MAAENIAERPTSLGEVPPEFIERKSRFNLPPWLVVLWANRKSRVGLVMLSFFVFVAVFAPWLAPYDPRSTEFLPLEPRSGDHWLGTTQAGQDIYSQLVWSFRTSMLVGLFGGGLATIIGLVIGLIAGYMGGWVDEILSFFMNLFLVIPTLPLMIVFAAYSPVEGILPVVLVIGFTSWAGGARLKRSQMITLRERDYITASVFAGEPMWRIVFREIMPNMTSLVLFGFIGAAAGAIGAEAGLAFIGVGDPETISWGTMSYWADNSGALLFGAWAWFIPPGLMLALLLTALTLINFGVDAISNPHLRED